MVARKYTNAVDMDARLRRDVMARPDTQNELTESPDGESKK